MKTRWMMVGSLLTLVAIVALAVLGGVALAQQGTDEATPEPAVVDDAPALSGLLRERSADWFAHRDSHSGGMGRFDRRSMGMWHHVGDEDLAPLAHLADIIGISSDELHEALADGQTLAEIAAANGMERDELVDALLAEAQEHLALAVETGILDQEQIEFIQDWMADGVGLLVDHPLPVGEEWLELGFHDWHNLLDAEDFDLPERLAELFGLTLDELVEAILDGSSLAEIAEANGVDPQTVTDFFVTEAEAKLNEAVAAEYLTEEQAQALRSWIEDGVELLVNNSLAFPNGLEMIERLGTRFGSPFGDMDWEKWSEFDWAQFIGQNPLSVAADTIGISRGELLEAMLDGQSMAEIAETYGVDPQTVIDVQTEAMQSMLDDLAAEGFFPADKLDFITGHLGQGMEMFAGHDFPFAKDWSKLGDWAPWGKEGAPWMERWLDCCPCDATEGGE